MTTENKKNNELIAQLWGWILFVICGVLFTLSGVRAQDALTITASIVFLLACVVFMIPLVKAIKRVEKPE